MTDRTITLRSDLVERLEALAERQGRTLNHCAPIGGSNWARAVAEGVDTVSGY